MKNLTKKYHIKCFKHLLFARFKTAYLENNSKNNISKKFLITLFLLLSLSDFHSFKQRII